MDFFDYETAHCRTANDAKNKLSHNGFHIILQVFASANRAGKKAE